MAFRRGRARNEMCMHVVSQRTQVRGTHRIEASKAHTRRQEMLRSGNSSRRRHFLVSMQPVFLELGVSSASVEYYAGERLVTCDAAKSPECADAAQAVRTIAQLYSPVLVFLAPPLLSALQSTQGLHLQLVGVSSVLSLVNASVSAPSG